MKLNLLNDTKLFSNPVFGYITSLIGLKRITRKFWDRWIASGGEYSDIELTMSRIKGFDHWCEEWCKTAKKYEKLAEEASVYYYLAQWAVFDLTD